MAANTRQQQLPLPRLPILLVLFLSMAGAQGSDHYDIFDYSYSYGDYSFTYDGLSEDDVETNTRTSAQLPSPTTQSPRSAPPATGAAAPSPASQPNFPPRNSGNVATTTADLGYELRLLPNSLTTQQKSETCFMTLKT